MKNVFTYLYQMLLTLHEVPFWNHQSKIFTTELSPQWHGCLLHFLSKCLYFFFIYHIRHTFYLFILFNSAHKKHPAFYFFVFKFNTNSREAYMIFEWSVGFTDCWVTVKYIFLFSIFFVYYYFAFGLAFLSLIITCRPWKARIIKNCFT